MKSNLFCNTDCSLNEGIKKLLVKNIFTSDISDEVTSRYNDMQNNFDKSYDEWQNSFTTQGRPHNGFDDTTAIVISSAKSQYPELTEFNRIGFDLPTWMNIRKDNKRVMFIAQDPLKSTAYKDCHDIVVSSPFAMHDKEHRESRHGRLIFAIFEDLIENGYGIYLTDYKKLYMHGDEEYEDRASPRNKQKNKEARKKTNDFQNKLESMYASFLNEEIEIVDPSLIVTFGKKSSNLLLPDFKFFNLSSYKKIPTLPMIHPSGTARGSLKKKLKLDNYTLTSVSSAYSMIVKDVLNEP